MSDLDLVSSSSYGPSWQKRAPSTTGLLAYYPFQERVMDKPGIEKRAPAGFKLVDGKAVKNG